MTPDPPDAAALQPMPQTTVLRGRVYLSPAYLRDLAGVLRNGTATAETCDLVATISSVFSSGCCANWAYNCGMTVSESRGV